MEILFGFPQEVVTIDYVINASNHFDYWDTTEGDLKDVSDISHSWLSDFRLECCWTYHRYRLLTRCFSFL